MPPGAADEPVDQEADVLPESALLRAPFLDLSRKEPKKKKR